MLNAWRRHCGRHRARLPLLLLRRAVLNAWRRHCGRHRHNHRNPSHPRNRAQRLAASLRSARVGEKKQLRLGHASAQRLAASLRSAPWSCAIVCSQEVVLNAWQRHCGRHQMATMYRELLDHRAQRLAASLRSAHCHSTIGVSHPGVLNAWRRHCGRHQDPRSVLDCRSVCSTPGGVTAVGTVILNPTVRQAEMCSTPGGVTAVGTTGAGVWALAAAKCSTPGGVTAVGTAGFGAGVPGERLVLNAWRRHCGRHNNIY